MMTDLLLLVGLWKSLFQRKKYEGKECPKTFSIAKRQNCQKSPHRNTTLEAWRQWEVFESFLVEEVIQIANYYVRR